MPTARVLVVDDEDGLRRAMVRILERAGYTVFAAATGAEALAVLAREGPQLDLLLTDLHLPDTDGRELARRVRETAPEIRVLHVSGSLETSPGPPQGSGSSDMLLLKPFTPEELFNSLAAVGLERPPAAGA